MKRILLAIALAGGVAGTTQAQMDAKPTALKPATDASAQQSPEKRTEVMREMLNLSPAQVKQLLEVHTLISQKQSHMTRDDQKKGGMTDLDAYRDDQYKQILTPEQLKQWRDSGNGK